ncbi:cupin domain-containing protein [Breoghania sp. L-A4]|uniref:cupin domain-containing protein n=1 Tax=Breoghania sp. L-A4 TaxID=2304600 RepID=UPI000E35DF2C|nr:cupin domain-containing protein [Breoghania sp. L-A4]AXS38843.1 cupin domain-containing protein [Breoghania sp. L-A4]
MTDPLYGLSADEMVRRLELQRHPEGGYFRETFRDGGKTDGRALSTAIYYLLPAGEISRWHRVDASEMWHFYAGAPLALSISADGQDVAEHTLGPDIANDQRPQVIVPPHAWQSAESLGAWTLAGCTVSPGFEFSGFEMAPDGWEPGPA